ncbi:LMO7 [Mytilus coruscus]|uniref:LMO7 n=1 Tax=Mytilus coruscus TaxID=42192 RepID=A0A6J8ENR6_MYTCO|nr:LMO7 [Mytilus coruscus]
MANEENDESWNLKLRQDTEQEYFTELALHEAERWIQAVTRKKFQYPDDFRKSLENGVLLCELLNNLKTGSVKRINKLPTPLAGLDNINVFLNACKKNFGLKENQLFDPCDLEDLSQRAIAHVKHAYQRSEHSLQQEVGRRNTNVAITVYWLGRIVETTCSGPHLDQSAFSALVNIHRKDILSDKPAQHDSFECSGYSSAYSSHDGKEGPSDSVDRKHNRDSSYDSFGSYGHSRESSLTEELNMPVGSDMRRYGSTSSLNRSGELRLSSNLETSYDGFHQSTPDLTNAHTRTSSVDSYDDSHGNHSRQSSDSVDIPTRTTKTQRKVSQSEDPLKFIKLKPSKDLAKQAVEQITMVKEVKQVRKTIEREEEDWQSNLSSWKNRRRRVSAATIERVEGADDMNRSEEEKKKPPKTYDQIKKEREKRKSVGQLPVHFYPIEDNEDLLWDVKTPSKAPAPAILEAMSRKEANQTESEPPKRAPLLSAKNRSKSMGNAFTGSGVSIWADRDKEEKDTPYKSKTENRSSRTLDENHNAEKPPNQSARRLSNKFSSMLKSFESKEDNDTSKVYEKPPRKTFEFSVDSKSDKFKDPKILDTQTARSTLQPKKKAEPTRPRNYIEKDIKIKQKAHNPKGFGITVIGGQDKKQPVIIDKVNLGSAADVCEVQAKDEIISINNRDIGIMTQAMVRKVIDDANKKGELEIRVRRYNAGLLHLRHMYGGCLK